MKDQGLPHVDAVDATPRARLRAPATERNREPILAVLDPFLPASGTVLEIASGTGEHAIHFSRRIPRVSWQPTDLAEEMLSSIGAWVEAEGIGNLNPPLRLDVRDQTWPVETADAVVAINMIHISPWDCCEALFDGAARILPAGGGVFLYGPYKIDGVHTAPSNEAFDASLRARDPEWGVRDLGAVVEVAKSRGFGFEDKVAMPANNFSVLFRKG